MLSILFVLFYQIVCTIVFIQETTSADFGDLDKLLLGGAALAIVVAVGFTVVRMRLVEKKPPAERFLSINSFKEK